MTEPRQKPGKSRQDFETPDEFIRAVEQRFGRLSCDLAANDDLGGPGANHKAPLWWGPGQDALVQDWTRLAGNLWLNPPFGQIPRWAAKCAASAGDGRRIIMLSPASIGTNWFADHVHGRALVLALNPRITFVGESHPYPKDLMITVWGPKSWIGLDVWRWRPLRGPTPWP